MTMTVEATAAGGVTAAPLATVATPTAIATFVTVTSPPPVQYRIETINPQPAACPPPVDSPHYNGNRTIDFQWRLDRPPVDGSVFSVFVGPIGSAKDRGPGSLAGQTSSDEWTFRLAVGSIYEEGVTEYQWRVVYLAPDRNPINSEWSCFRITNESGGGGGPAATSTPETQAPPPNTDSDGDGVPNAQDQCPDKPQGDDPDFARPGCPMPPPPAP